MGPITNKTKSIKVKQNCSFKKKEEMQHFGILAMSVMVLTCLVQVHAESVPENANEMPQNLQTLLLCLQEIWLEEMQILTDLQEKPKVLSPKTKTLQEM